MKKAWWIVALSLLGLGLLLLALSFATNGFQFKLPGGERVEMTEETYKVNEPFDKLSFELESGDLELVLSEDGKCRVLCNEMDKLHYEVAVQNGTLTVKEVDERSWTDTIGIFSGKQKVTAYLPETAYRALTVTISTGDVKIPKDFSFEQTEIKGNTADIDCAAASLGNATVKTNTGDIELKDGTAEALTVENNTGEIELDDITARTIDVKVSTGSVSLRNTLAERIDAVANTGDIRFAKCDAEEIHARATTGSITGSLRTPKIFMAEATTGRVDVPKSTVGGLCELKTTTGDIRIEVSD